MKEKKENWLKLLGSYARPCMGKMLAAVVLAVCSAVGGFVPYIGVYHIMELFIRGEAQRGAVLYWVAVCGAGYVVMVVCYGISTSLSHYSAYTVLEQMRLAISTRLMKAPLGKVTGNTIGHLKNIFVEKVDGVERPLAHMIPEFGANLLLTLGVIVYLFTIEWRMGLASLVTLPVAVIPMLLGAKAFNEKYTAYMQANDRVNSTIIEYVEGIEVVKTFNQTTGSYEKYQNEVNSFREFTLDWFRSTWLSMNMMFAILPSTLLGTVPVGVLLYQRGSLSVTDFAMCLILSMGIISPCVKLTSYINEMKGMQYNVLGANELLSMESLPEKEGKTELKGYDVVLQNVNFSYEEGAEENLALKNLSLKLPQGTVTALVGPSGGGKSTVAKLVDRFWDVSSGSISIGGVDIREMSLEQLSKTVSFVTQDNYLFDCSLRENIRLGKPDATDEEVYAAAKRACCDEFITKLEKGYDTPAGEAGKSLSGGEKQRVAIARAILKGAPILLLDEATSFTDPENEERIQESISELAKGKTLLVIAHRLSTIQDADNIVVLEKGEIAASGTHEALLRECPLYETMWKNHMGVRDWAVGGREHV